MNNRIENAMKDKGLNQSELAKKLDVTPQSVQQWIDGKTAPKSKRLAALAKELGVSQAWLLGDDNAQPKTASNVELVEIRGKVPLISWVQAGDWCEAIDIFMPGDADEWLLCPVKCSKHTYALRVQGDSMTANYGRSYPEGSVIFVDPEKPLTNGCRVIAKLPNSNEVTFKEYREDAGKRYLKPLNPQYAMQEISEDTRLCGVIIGQYLAE